MKEKIKLIIVFVLGIMISVVISVYAATVIGASEVSYTDNKGIGASNVQDAINGVYNNANTLATNVTKLMTFQEGYMTLNTSVLYTNSDKFATYRAYSGWCCVTIYGIKFNSNPPSSGTTVATGGPKAAYSTEFTIDGSSTTLRLKISQGSNVIITTSNASTPDYYTGQFCYPYNP